MAKSKDDKLKSQDPAFGYLPMQVDVGWISQVEARRDAIDKAKGHIDSRFSAKEASWYRVLPFMGGYLWEAHEGGPGKSYLDSIVNELTRNPNGEYWIPSGEKRVVRIAMRDGKPTALMPNEVESLKIRNSGQAPLIAKGSMKPFARKGTEMLVFGGVMAGSGVIYMLASAAFFLSVWQPGPMVRPVKLIELPHSQWDKVQNTNPETIVSKMEFTGGRWGVVTRNNVIPALEQERKNGQDINNSFDNKHFDFEDKKIIDSLSPGQPAFNPSSSVREPGQPDTSKANAVPASTNSAPSSPPSVDGKSAPSQAPQIPTTAPPVPPVVHPVPTQVPAAPVTQNKPVSPPASAPSVNPAAAEQERAKRVMEQLQRIKELKATQEKQSGMTGSAAGTGVNK